MALSKRKKKWIFIISIIVILLALIGGNYLKNKHEEHQIVDKAKNKAVQVFKEKENMDVIFTSYEISPMNGFFLDGHVKGDKSNKVDAMVEIDKEGNIKISSYGYDKKPKGD